jgi:hypothetical protein
MADYYRYLWSTTWPNLIMFCLIWGVILFRLVWKFVMTWRYEHDAWGFLFLMGKILLWVGILGIYTKLLLFSQPDWYYQPGFFQGSVLEKAYDSGTRSYIIIVHSELDEKQFYVDQNVFDHLKMEDQVKLMYLPVRREVVRCEVIGNLHK